MTFHSENCCALISGVGKKLLERDTVRKSLCPGIDFRIQVSRDVSSVASDVSASLPLFGKEELHRGRITCKKKIGSKY